VLILHVKRVQGGRGAKGGPIHIQKSLSGGGLVNLQLKRKVEYEKVFNSIYSKLLVVEVENALCNTRNILSLLPVHPDSAGDSIPTRTPNFSWQREYFPD